VGEIIVGLHNTLDTFVTHRRVQAKFRTLSRSSTARACGLDLEDSIKGGRDPCRTTLISFRMTIAFQRAHRFECQPGSILMKVIACL